ncbi:MAG: hypothetical protein WBA74_16150, partial [Cyclobacteriaceae bacterium]
MKELYHDEVSNLEKFRKKIDSRTIYIEDLEFFSEQYEELIAQAKVITRVSDRLQKKLDNANTQIRDQNSEISEKNEELETAVNQLVAAKVGRKASTILFVITITLLIIEEYAIDPLLENFAGSEFISIGIKIATAVVAKLFEGRLEDYFLRKEKDKIIRDEYGKVIVKEN